jgi:hypothetical protein
MERPRVPSIDSNGSSPNTRDAAVTGAVRNSGEMASRPTRRTGVLVLRVWREGDVGVRARITHTSDVLLDSETSIAVCGVDHICEVVRAWLELFEHRDDSVTTR